MTSIPEHIGPDHEVDPDGRIPVYLQIAGIIAARIRDGRYKLDRPIPSEEGIRQEWGVSRATARKSVRVLASTGYVETVMGRGSYVIWKP